MCATKYLHFPTSVLYSIRAYCPFIISALILSCSRARSSLARCTFDLFGEIFAIYTRHWRPWFWYEVVILIYREVLPVYCVSFKYRRLYVSHGSRLAMWLIYPPSLSRRTRSQIWSKLIRVATVSEIIISR